MNPSPELFAKLLPDVVVLFTYRYEEKTHELLFWRIKPNTNCQVRETEYLHLCHLAEKSVCGKDGEEWDRYYTALNQCCENGDNATESATWQQRLTALAEVRGWK